MSLRKRTSCASVEALMRDKGTKLLRLRTPLQPVEDLC
jgi:hypothetical protein